MMMKKYEKQIIVLVSGMFITLIAGLPMLARGIGGDVWDLTYHLLRIEAVKEALAAGSFPPRVNPLFLEGYGYGSSLFYPDIFLVIPAVLNLIGISPLLSYKLFMLLVIFVGVCTTFYAMNMFCKDYKCALVGTGVLMLSTYYLADINNRAGLSEILACIFVPILMAGIYDYFAYEGKRVYLLGIAFAGLALSHTIMTFIGVVLTLFVFIIMVFVPSKRRLMFGKKRFLSLLLTAVLTIASVSYYIFPMLEQMAGDRFWFNEPWAKVGEYTQTVESFFAPVGVFMYNAKFGVGIPVLLLLAGRVFVGKVKNKWADFFLVMGVLLFVAMTNAVPWKALEGTLFNMIQFPYRFYPYALFWVICGMTAVLAEKIENGIIGNGVLVFLVLLTVVCGIWQNVYCYRFGTRIAMNKEYLYENTCLVGKGEWVPEGVTEAVFKGEDGNLVSAEDGACISMTEVDYSDYLFEIEEENGTCFVAPLLYYKGYAAQLILSDGQRKELKVSKSKDGLVQINVEEESAGAVNVWYEGTMIQKVSNLISLVVALGVCLIPVVFKLKKRKSKREEACM